MILLIIAGPGIETNMGNGIIGKARLPMVLIQHTDVIVEVLVLAMVIYTIIACPAPGEYNPQQDHTASYIMVLI